MIFENIESFQIGAQSAYQIQIVSNNPRKRSKQISSHLEHKIKMWSTKSKCKLGKDKKKMPVNKMFEPVSYQPNVTANNDVGDLPEF